MPAPPVIGMAGIIDAHDEVRLPLGIGLIAAQDAAGRGQDPFILRHIVAQRIQIAQRASAPPREDRQQDPSRCRVADHDVGAGGARLLQQGMARVRFDHHDAGRAPRVREPPQQRHGQRVQAGKDRGVPHEPGPEAAQRLPPQHRRRGHGPEQRRPQADDLPELQGERRLPRARAGTGRPAAGSPRTGRAPRPPRPSPSARHGRAAATRRPARHRRPPSPPRW